MKFQYPISRLILSVLAVLMCFGLNAQLNVASGLTGQQLVDILTSGGASVEISNVTLVSPGSSTGSFSNGNTTNIGLDAGILLTSGSVNVAPGPNNDDDAGVNNGAVGDADLGALVPQATYDAAYLQFDVVPQGNTITFNYVFASEEYEEYFCTQFNDVFAFFVTGGGYTNENIALVPGTNDPVSINNVGPGPCEFPENSGVVDNSSEYNNNSGGTTIQYDGFTNVFTATIEVEPCVTYRFKLAVADAGDGILDSGVFIEAGSFTSELTCPADIIVGNDMGECGAIVYYETIEDPCPFAPEALPGYTLAGTYNGSTYFVSNVATDVFTAYNNAIAAGAHLATISSDGENTFVANAAGGGRAWIGLDDADIEGKFQWDTGEELNYTNWAAGEPNDDGGVEDWTEINRFGFGLWNDLPSNINLRSVIEFDGLPVVTSGMASGCFFEVGVHEVCLQATDLSGNSSTCCFNITVNDTEPPTAACQDISILLDEAGMATITDDAIDAGSTDNCGPVTLSAGETSFDCADAYAFLQSGTTTTVTLTVEDGAGNMSSCTGEVAVLYDESLDGDCDGISDACDICENGDDSVDSNGDGIPDCSQGLELEEFPDEWICSNGNKIKVLICHRPPGNPDNGQTQCISPSALPAHLNNHPDWLGPCSYCEVEIAVVDIEDNLGHDHEFTVYPNPASDVIMIEHHAIQNGNVQLRITDSQGKVVWSRNIDEPGASNLQRFDIATQSSILHGVYFVSVISDEGVDTQPIVIIK